MTRRPGSQGAGVAGPAATAPWMLIEFSRHGIPGWKLHFPSELTIGRDGVFLGRSWQICGFPVSAFRCGVGVPHSLLCDAAVGGLAGGHAPPGARAISLSGSCWWFTLDCGWAA